MIRKVYEVDPMICPKCGGTMKIIAFITEYAVVDRIIDHLKLIFVAERPPPPRLAYQELLMAAEAARGEPESRPSLASEDDGSGQDVLFPADDVDCLDDDEVVAGLELL